MAQTVTDWHDVAARHRTLVRDANERISAEAARNRHESADSFNCECEDPACDETVHLTQREYELVRASPTHFLIFADHEDPQVERLVAENARFAIVQTLPGIASRIALRSDPRATT
jgi:hypothetical protein